MGKLIVTNMVSLDGYFEGPDGNVMALPFDHMFDPYCAERLRAAETMVVGAKSYQGFQSYWPPIADNPDAAPDEREVSRLLNAIPKLVISDSLPESPAGPWAGATRVVRRADAHKRIDEAKRAAERDVVVFASHVLWNDLLAAGLVDELHLIVGAGIVGGGTPAFTTPPPGGLRLLGTRTWEGSHNVVLQYAAG
ncbi:MAG: deaminase [Micromonosporaceae bacterium]|nr:deaminase [Micromonosporaceae bacterium]